MKNIRQLQEIVNEGTVPQGLNQMEREIVEAALARQAAEVQAANEEVQRMRALKPSDIFS